MGPRPGKFFVRSQGAIRAASPGAELVRQHRFAGVTNHVGRSLAEMFEQHLIRFYDFEIGVVRQNDVVDGIEGIHPLPL